MKKKIFGFIFAIALIFGITACGEKQNKKEEAKIEYTAIYKLGKNKIKTYKKDNEIYYKVETSNFENIGSSEISKNSINLDAASENAKLTFKKGSALVKSDSVVKSGTYKNEGVYSNEEFYDDFYGDKSYLNSKMNGIYVKDDTKMYVYQMDGNNIRVFYILDGATSDFTIEKSNEEKYHLDFFEETYDISFTDDSMILDLQTNDERNKILSGTYKKDSKLELDEIIKTYSPF